MSTEGFEPREIQPPSIVRIIESLLFVGGVPLSYPRAAEAVRDLTPEQLEQAVATLNHEYQVQGRPYRVQRREEGFDFCLKPAFRSVQEKLLGARRETRLSPQALDALALVAYRQPISRPEVDALRGGDSVTLLRQLVRLGLIAVQRGDAGRNELLYGTTSRFLRVFGLRNLDDLPRTQDVHRM